METSGVPCACKHTPIQVVGAVLVAALCVGCTLFLSACNNQDEQGEGTQNESTQNEDTQADNLLTVDDISQNGAAPSNTDEEGAASNSEDKTANSSASAQELYKKLDITEDYRKSFVHGDKGAEYQKYIVLHDTEGEGSASGVIDYWDNNGAGVAAHFVINKDGSIVQCVSLDKIAHHAGFGDTGHNKKYGVTDESRDDKKGTKSIGSWASDYGMNSYSVGIEMVHVGGSGDYPKAQLEALDNLIAYIDAYYGFESTIIDHKAWRSGNSDTSKEFASYLKSYQSKRTYK